jgi:hypothetical protein
MGERLKHSGYKRDGLKLTVGRLWEVDTSLDNLRELNVYASSKSIRIVDAFCGDWEFAERNAIYLTVDQARALGEILLAAADVAERESVLWSTDKGQADPGPLLRKLLLKQVAEKSADTP